VHYGEGSAFDPNSLVLSEFGPPVVDPTPTGTPTATPTRTATATPTERPTVPTVSATRSGTSMLLGLLAFLCGVVLVLRRGTPHKPD
jgi:hypothetical protein